jgi:hypothetical protein
LLLKKDMIESIRLTDDFIVQEFVPKEVYDVFGLKSAWFIDIRIVYICQFLRDYICKQLTVNDWYFGGNYNNSGFRKSDTTIGAVMSQHKYGRAVDIKIEGLTPQEIEFTVVNQWIELRRLGLSTMEKIDKTPTWVHLDVRYTGMGSLFIV